MGTILVCTRGEDILRDLAPLLRGEHKVAIVPHVADAVRSLLLTRFDAFVMDMDEETPERLEALPIIGRLNPRFPTLTVSRQETLEAEARIRAAGASCLLLRPLVPGELYRHVEAALRRRAAEGAAGRRLMDAQPETNASR